MKKRIISILLVLCMMIPFLPTTVLAAGSSYGIAIGNAHFTALNRTISVGGGVASYDPSKAKLTLKNITLYFDMASAAAIESSVPNLEIVLSGTNTINITQDKMYGIWLYGGGNARITGDSQSKLIINSKGKNNRGIVTGDWETGKGMDLTVSGTSIEVYADTTDAASRGYMVGILPRYGSTLTMDSVNFTAIGVQSGIEMDLNSVAKLSGVNFNIMCAPRQSFDSTVPNEMSIGVNLAPIPDGEQNEISYCRGSISAHYPLYIDGPTALKNSYGLTLTTDNYASAYVNSDLTVTGGALNLTSTGSSGNGFYVLKSSKLVFNGSQNVTVNVGNAAVFLVGDTASVDISGGTLSTTAKGGVLLSKPGNTFTLSNGTLEMTPKSGETKAIGLHSYGTVNIEGGSIITSKGMYSALQNAGGKTFSISGGTHTLSTEGGLAGYADVSGSTLKISGTANVTFDGWTDGFALYGTMNFSGGRITVRNARDGIYTTGTLDLYGGTLNTSGSQSGALVGDGGIINFAGTDATLAGQVVGLGKTSGSGTYCVTSGKVVLQGGTYAASTIYSSLASGYGVFDGPGNLISNPTVNTFVNNSYLRIDRIPTYTLTLVNVKGATSASYTAGADISYTAADAPSGQHFAYWEMKVGSGAAEKVGTNPTYTGKMPSGNATLTAVYENCSGGKATCLAKAKCSVCGKEYGILAAHTFTAEVVDQKYEVTPRTCESEGVYYKSCSVCGASAKNWNNATFTVPALGHDYKTVVTAPTCTEKGFTTHTCTKCGDSYTDNEVPALGHKGGTATCTKKAACSVCGQLYGELAAHSFNKQAKTAEALRSEGTCQAKAVYYYSCSVCNSVEYNDSHTFEGEKDPSNHVGCLSVSGTVTSLGSNTDPVTLQLIRSGSSEPAYETVVSGNTAAYSVYCVQPGTYTLKAVKAGHITAEYTLTVGESVKQNVTMFLETPSDVPGDVNGDGLVTLKDILLLRKIVAGVETLPDSYLANADVNGDGYVTLKDILLLRKVVAGIATL